VRGEVLQPGRYKLTSGLTVVRALAAAGGYTEFANPRKVKILRGGKAFYVNLRELEQYPDRDIEIKPGDVMVVPRSMF
jgi:polysaccharide export outer membrane protein